METHSLQPVSDTTRNELICERIKQYIIDNRLRCGDRLPSEESLGHALSVSRAAVREALRSLESLGIVEAKQGFGWIVREFNFDSILKNLLYALAFHNASIQHITEIRKALDLYFLGTALQRLTDQDLDTLSQLVTRMKQHQLAGWGVDDEDRCFHRLLIERGGNPVALQWFDVAWEAKNKAYTLHGWRQFDNPAAAHAVILNALRQRNLGAAREAILAHYARLEELMQQDIERAAHQRATKDPAGHPQAA